MAAQTMQTSGSERLASSRGNLFSQSTMQRVPWRLLFCLGGPCHLQSGQSCPAPPAQPRAREAGHE
eukprot:9346742-Pyramimonas_sp.AAC.1